MCLIFAGLLLVGCTHNQRTEDHRTAAVTATGTGTAKADCTREWRELSLAPTRYSRVRDVFSVVAASSATNVWAGGYRGRRRVTYPLLGHWNGRRWREWRLRSPGRGTVIAVLPNGEAWTVFYSIRGPSGLLRWDGRKFLREAAPRAAVINTFTELVVTDAGLWLKAATRRGAMLFRRQGSRWVSIGKPYRDVDTLGRGPRGELWSLAFYPAKIARWSGRWTSTDLPRLHDASLTGLTLTTTGTAFAWGSEPFAGPGLLLTWNDRRWIRFDEPTFRGEEVAISSVAGSSPRDLWATATRVGYSGRARLFHRDGTSWTPIPPSDYRPDGAGGSLVMAENDLWVASESVARYGCAPR